MKHHQANGKGFGAEFSHFKARGQGTKRTTNFCYICPPPLPKLLRLGYEFAKHGLYVPLQWHIIALFFNSVYPDDNLNSNKE